MAEAAERLRLATSRLQGPHERRDRSLPERLGVDQSLQVSDGVCRPARLDQCQPIALFGNQPEFVRRAPSRRSSSTSTNSS